MINDKKTIYAWAFYDWANSAYATTVMAGFFPIFFKTYYSVDTDAATSTAQLGIANSISSFIIVLVAPLLGAIADKASLKKKFLFIFAYIGILMSLSLSFVDEGSWCIAAFIYILGNIGFMGSNIFYDSLLPNVSNENNIDYVSGIGFAFGYLGGGVLFALNVWMVQDYSFFSLDSKIEAIKISFFSVGIWWAIFSIPLMLFVKEEKKDNSSVSYLKDGYTRLKKTFKKTKKLKGLLLFLAAYWLYIDGVDTIIRMSVDYGMALGFESGSLITALLIVQFVGFPATLLFIKLTRPLGTKTGIFIAIGIYILITLFASLMDEIYEFYILAVLIALVQGSIQALSRSYYAKMIPSQYSAEFFSFYNFLGKFAAILGPLLVAGIAILTQNPRLAIASVVVFFILGSVLLYFVDEKTISKEIKNSLT